MNIVGQAGSGQANHHSVVTRQNEVNENDLHKRAYETRIETEHERILGDGTDCRRAYSATSRRWKAVTKALSTKVLGIQGFCRRHDSLLTEFPQHAAGPDLSILGRMSGRSGQS
jgi:hypothetical protein